MPALPRSKVALSGTVTKFVVPLNESPLPDWPVVHVAPVIVPLLEFPEPSATVVPVPSLNPYAAPSPVGAAGVVALATFE